MTGPEYNAGTTPNRLDRIATWMFAALAMCFVFAAGVVISGPAHGKYASYVVEADSGRVLHAVNERTRNFPASLTKMMTLHMVFDALDSGKLTLKQKLKASRRAWAVSPSKLGLVAGDTITVEQAILALVTKSANDVAVVVAETLGKREREFAKMMTRRAREIGMNRTTFRNASGLPNRGQLSTAQDMATLAKSLLNKHAKYYHYFSTASFKYEGRKHKNHNKLLNRYKGVDGIKTGYIHASGYNLVTSAERDGRRLIGVVFGAKSSAERNRHMATLLDKGFKKIGLVESGTELARRDNAKGRATGTWGVQVGAFKTNTQAKSAAERAQSKAGDHLDHGRVVISPVRGRKGKFYRARIIDLTRRQAYGACRALKSRRLDCMPLQDTRKDALQIASAK